MIPVSGFHSVIDSPDSVSRVMPPTTTIAMIRPATNHSQWAIARGLGRAEIENGSISNTRHPGPVPGSAVPQSAWLEIQGPSFAVRQPPAQGRGDAKERG